MKLCTTFCPILYEKQIFISDLVQSFCASVSNSNLGLTLFQIQQANIHENNLLFSTKNWYFGRLSGFSKKLKQKWKLRQFRKLENYKKKPPESFGFDGKYSGKNIKTKF